ncbi:hypothetical protein GF312_07850 [Candidatus Poribacteria bacterium]|nr:hypothetical protein [Candidatus Poribacteria bacterium]
MPDLTIPIPRTPPDLKTISEITIKWLLEKAPEKIITPTKTWKNEHWRVARWAIWAQGIGPMLYFHLRDKASFNEFPRHFCQYLSGQYYLNSQRISVMMDELYTILDAFNENRIDVIPLKGSLLNVLYYKDPGLRPMADIDLLVKPVDMECIHNLLSKMGYKVLNESWRHRVYVIAKASRKLVLEGEHPENPRQLEIHFDIRENFLGVDYRLSDLMWNNCHPGKIGNSSGMILDPWALLIHLLLHTNRHIWKHSARFRQLVDISIVASELSKNDWSKFLEEMACISRKHVFYSSFLFVMKYPGMDLPSEVCDKLSDYNNTSLHKLLKRMDLSDFSVCNPSPISPFERFRWNESGRDHLTSFLHIISPAHSWSFLLWFICYMMGFSRYDPFNDYFIKLRNYVVGK